MSICFAAVSNLPTPFGEFTLYGFEDKEKKKECLALTFGEIKKNEATLIRIHSECLTGDALFSTRCDCGSQLRTAMQAIVKEGQGVLLYLRQEGRGIGLLNKIRAYHLQDGGLDTVEANIKLGFPADMRNYDMCKPMLDYLKVSKLRLMTNNPDKVNSLKALGFQITERVPLQTGKNSYNEKYLSTKIEKLDHFYDSPH